LILATVVVVIMSGLGAAFLTLSFYQNKSTFNAAMSEGALYSCEAGLEDALNRMNAYANAAWTYMSEHNLDNPSYYYPPTDADFNCFYRTYEYVTGQSTPMTVMVRRGMYPGMPGFNQFPINRGTYSVEIRPAFDGSRRPYTIRSTGTHGAESRRIEVVATPDVTTSLSGIAAFGDVSLDATGSLFVDSYKSTLGTYAAQYSAARGYARNGGTLGSNGPVSVRGSSKIYGDVWVGVGQNPPTNQVGSNIFGNNGAQALPAAVAIPPQGYPVPAGLAAGAFNGNQNQTIGAAGINTSVRYADLQTRSQKTITIKGNVTMYVDGLIAMHAQSSIILDPGATLKVYQGPGNNDLTLNGGSSAGGGSVEPYRYQFYSASTGFMKFNGNSDNYGSFYAPHATVRQNGNATLYGKVTFKEIEVMNGNFTLHFDEDLNTDPEAPPKYDVRSWRETLQ
jgi:hypothetical protein